MQRYARHAGVLALLISLLFIAGLFSHLLTPRDAVLAGWDTVPHFYNFTQFSRFLGNGDMRGYDIRQLGGVPLFYFYTPLPYLIGTLIKAISGGAFSLAFSWRLLHIVAVLFSACALWFFARTFAPRSTLPLAALFGVWYAAYPSAFFTFGIGAAAIENGLFTSSFGISFALLFLACLERFRETGRGIHFSLSILFLVLSVLSSLIISVFLAFLWILYLISAEPIHLPKKRWFMAHAAIAGAAFLLLSFFIVPFVAYHGFQSARPQPFPNNNTGTLVALLAPFVSLLTEYKNASVPFSGVANSFLFLGSLGTLVLFLRGLLGRERDAKRDIVRMFFYGLLLLQLFSYAVSYLFPFVTIHYYRAAPFILIFFLVLALFGAARPLGSRFTHAAARRIMRGGFGLLALGIVGWAIMGSREGPPSFLSPLLGRDLYHMTAPYYADMARYPDSRLAEDIVARIMKENTNRIFVEGDIYQSSRLGSPHAIATMLNMKGRATLNGLFLESSNQADSIMPTYHGNSHTLLWGYGEDSLIYNFDLITQYKEMLGRLRLFGVDYLIVHSQDAIDRIGLLGPEAEEIASFGSPEREIPEGMQYALLNYRIYRFKDALPLVRIPQEAVGLFVDDAYAGRTHFKDFTKALFARRELYDLPIAFTGNIADVSGEELGAFDFFIVNGDTADDSALMERLLGTEKKVIVYRRATEDLYAELSALKQKGGNRAPARLIAFDNERVRFEAGNGGPSPWIVNLGYFPVWRSDRTVFEVSPGQMLVIAKGGESVALSFDADPAARAGVLISLSSLLIVPFLVNAADKRYGLFRRGGSRSV